MELLKHFDESIYGTAVPIILAFCAYFLFRSRFDKRSEKKHNRTMAPGPKGWPFLGYVPFIMAKNPTKLMNRLRKKYGNIFGFRLGVHYCVMLSDYKSVREAFTKKYLLDRPSRYMRMSTEHQTLAELKGAAWEEQRFFLAQCLKKLGIGSERFEEQVLEEVSRTVPKMERRAGRSSCNIRDVISGSINNIVFTLACGRWFEDDDQLMRDFSHFQKLLVESFSNNMPVIYFPWVDWFLVNFQPLIKEVMKSSSIIERFIRSEVKSHELNHNVVNENDYMDLFLTEFKLREANGNIASFTKDQLVFNSMLLLLAGTDTVRNTLEWLLMIMAEYPHVQEQVHREIDCVLGRERMPEYKDKTRMPYTEAVIMESERWKTLEPLNLLRRTTADTVIRGYFIPKGSIVMNNLHFCHNDPSYWDKPKVFNPERFLSPDKDRVVVPEYFIPFSVGKRDCPGDKMTNVEIFLFFTVLMQRFKFSAPKGGVDFSASHRLNLQACNPILKVDIR